MTNRPRSHEIAALAVSAISQEWIKSGAVVEEVRNDYGEDLLVQTSWHGQMDDCRIWVQVKGRETVKRNRKGQLPTLRVPGGHASRWTNTADTVVIAVWDISQGMGWYALPQEQMDPFSLITSQTDSVGIYFHPDHKFDAAAARRLTWFARMRHVVRQLEQARMRQHNFEEMDREDAAQAAHRAAIAASFGFLMKIGLFVDDAIPPPEFDRGVRNAYVNIEDADYFSTPETRFDGAIHLAILAHLDDIAPELGVPHMLHRELVGAMYHLYIQHYGTIQNWWSSGPRAA
ncbi:DUF4365 domain-containing protein [Streptomyces sp. NPDC058583]|uniref:DUF4365 domain-containing protein n=1 Tax=unclassified Streptomyces TaxID=2593676 RepID=UPI00365CA1A1